MRNILFIFFVGISNLAFSQTIAQIDSVSNVFCDYLKQSDIKNDTLKISSLYNEQFNPYLRKIDQSKVQKIGKQLFYRLQRNCLEFSELLDRLEPPKEAIVRITEKPTSEISRKQLKQFKNQKDFYYLEVAGDTTNVVMQDGFWTDSFSDKTFSKLTYNWINDTEFELTFIESNNESRSNFSVKGDIYVYQVLSKEDGFYFMSVHIPGQKTYDKFKIYYK
ncbi:hypothetical protein IMCC3317_32300 [Kordia antarctica]|uniref:Uncharacterized protein n=1 Tax=Kordia antarctica TaxID=1218801 RepID=A0A7L4ZMY6_9FLAO|nr:hypothetical protein [Kordia antarctica]QHI37847.1 hypothetical protein IMCC3317_32300 [Kordia antarctica]